MKFNFRPYVPTQEDIERSRSPEAVAAIQKRLGDMFSSWRALYEDPFKGITTDGKIVEDLYSLGPNAAPTAPMVKATNELLSSLSDEQRSAAIFPIDRSCKI